jgi:hypothetical protein
MESSLNPNVSKLEPDRQQHDRPATCVIALQFLRLLSSRYEFIPGRKNLLCVTKVLFQFCYFVLNIVSLEVRMSGTCLCFSNVSIYEC